MEWSTLWIILFHYTLEVLEDLKLTLLHYENNNIKEEIDAKKDSRKVVNMRRNFNLISQ